jgi:serine/threonine protein kinase
VEQISFTPPTLEALNELLPSYRFNDFIAKGGMGAVYRATQISLDREVAIKILPPELSEDPEFHASFRTEARAMARLNHPNLIGIYDSGELDGMLYIVMEYVAGKSLYHSCWNKQIDPDEVKRIITAICDGLHHAHESGIIHRDIKPANILLTPKVEPKIGDFGLAQAVGSKHAGVVMGTPGYAAPEIMSHPEKMDRRSDIFAVGVILYEMLVGKLPAEGSLPSRESSCSKEFDAIYQNATHPNAAMRYSDAKKLSDALEAMSKGDSSGPRLLSSPSRGSMRVGGAGATAGRGSNPLARPAAGTRPMSVAKSAARPMTIAKTVAPVADPQIATPRVDSVPVAPRVIAEPEPSAPLPAPAATPAPAPRIVVPKDEEDDDSPLVIPTFSKSNQVSSWPLVRNMMLICILLVACVVAYQKLEIHKKKIEEQKAVLDRQQKEQRMAKNVTDSQKKDPAGKPNGANTGAATSPNTTTSRPNNTEPRRPETAMEELERLRFSLSRGDRTVMPKASKRKGELDYFLVTEEMRWERALKFCERHGAHIAFPQSEDDISFFADMLKNEETIWLGAGKSGKEDWVMISGVDWPLEKKPAGAGTIATLSYLGLLQASSTEISRPFVMAWYRDGSVPHTLDALLSITSKSLDTPDPQYPPGTLAMGSRMFLPILRKLTFIEAQNLASASGGHIAALSSEDEGFWLEDAMERGQAFKGIWLNGQLKGGAWKWGTGEAWGYAKWAKSFPAEDEEATQLAFIPGKGWINLPPTEEIDGVLIEWSNDSKDSGDSQEEEADTGSKDVNALQAKAQLLIKKYRKDQADKIAANVKKFTWDMDVWHRGLRSTDQTAWKPAHDHIKDQCKSSIVALDKIYSDEDVARVHEGIHKVHAFSLKKQQEIDAGFIASATKVRDGYISKIKEFGVAAKSAGQTKMVDQLKELLEDAEDAESWAESLLDE